MAKSPPSFITQPPQSMMAANKQDRVREMTKQEEILLKRKQEIERRLREGNSDPAQTAKGSGGRGLPTKTQTSKSSISMKSNKFANDGSFFKQFKEMVQKSDGKSHSNEVKNEKHNRISISSVFERDEEPPMKVVKKGHSEIDEDEAQSKNENSDMQQEWFQDALRRAKEKAKSLTNPGGAQPVGGAAAAVTSTSWDLTGGGSSDINQADSGTEDSLTKKQRRSRWAEGAGGAPIQSQGGISVPGVVIPMGVGAVTTVAGAPVPIPVVPIPVMPMPVIPTVAPITPNGSFNVPPAFMNMIGEGEHIDAIRGVMVTKMTRNNPAIIAYAQRVFGSLDLSEAQWKQCEEQMKMNVVFQLLQAKKVEAERLEQQGRVKYEYDSDEETEGGTWEHKRRATEMAETAYVAEELTENAEGKHHIGDYLPPEELARFMEKFRALKEGRDPDLSQYQENRLTDDNVGYRMLKSMGWTEGMGLGAQGTGITAPVSSNGRSENQGLGVDRPDNLDIDDDEFDAYRKRMMLAYRFRPNPLNNPRRQYY